MKLLSVQVGKPATYPASEDSKKEWRTAIFKNPVDGAVWVRALGLEGDGQANLKVHGGPFRAVNVYPSEHYDYWHETPGLEGMGGGAFGENFTTQGLLEDTVCIGDVYRVGEVLVQITQPRGPCNSLNRRWHNPDLMKRSAASGRVGWYLGVREEGQVRAGDTITLLERVSPGWTIARVWALTDGPTDKDALRELLEVKGLSEGWKEAVAWKLEK